MMSEKENNGRLLDIGEMISTKADLGVVVLIDGDRTLSTTDTTTFFFQSISIDYSSIKNIFKKHGYSYEGFLKVANFYTQIPPDDYAFHCINASQKVVLYPKLIELIESIYRSATVVIITAGMRLLWQNILEINNITHKVILVGGNHFHFDDYIIDQKAKGTIVNTIKSNGNQAVVFGDSLIDYDMMEKANYRFLVINEKRNIDIAPLIKGYNNLYQISFDGFTHPEIKISTTNDAVNLILDLCNDENK